MAPDTRHATERPANAAADIPSPREATRLKAAQRIETKATEATDIAGGLPGRPAAGGYLSLKQRVIEKLRRLSDPRHAGESLANLPRHQFSFAAEQVARDRRNRS